MSPTTSPRTILLLDSIAEETVTSKIKAAGAQYSLKILNSTPKNWKSIIETIKNKDTNQIIARILDQTFKLATQSAYADLFEKILDEIEKKPHIILIYRDNLLGKFEPHASKKPEEYFHISWTKEAQLQMQKIVERLKTRKLNLAPYRTRVERIALAHAFIEDSGRGLLLRLYIPSDRIWHNEIDTLLTLFRDYLTKFSDQPISLDQHRSERGITYAFYANDGSLKQDDFGSKLTEFSQLLDMCARDPQKAEELLKSTKLSPTELNSVVSRYAREARRLILDIDYERKSKMLKIQHRLHSELVDTLPPSAIDDIALKISDHAIPSPTRTLSIINLPTPPLPPPPSAKIDINDTYIQNIINEELRGRTSHSETDQELMRLFQAANSSQLISWLEELKDTSAPRTARHVAWQKLQAFVLQTVHDSISRDHLLKHLDGLIKFSQQAMIESDPTL